MYKDNQNRIDAYLRGEMNIEQKQLFENELADNEELREDYLLTKSIVNALRDRKEKLDLIKQWSREIEDEYNNRHRVADIAPSWTERRGVACTPTPRQKKEYEYKNEYAACPAPQRDENRKVAAINPKYRILKWIYGIGAAACVAVGFFAVKSLFYTTSSSEGNYMMPNFGAEAIYRSGNSDLSSLDSLITAKNYATALSSVDSLINETNKQLQVYETKDSLTERDEYKVEQYKADLYEMEWRKIHLLLALSKKDEAIRYLIQFSSQEGMYKFEADSLLETLNTTKR